MENSLFLSLPSLLSLSCLQRPPQSAYGEGLWRGLEAILGPCPKFEQHQLPLWGLRGGGLVPGTTASASG